MTPDILPALLATHAQHQPQAPALLAPRRSPLSHQQLLNHLQATVDILHGWGLGRGDRLALVLPNGPEMATAFLAAAACATSAPLNPAYREEEFDFYLSDLRAKALIIQADDASPAVTVARRRGIPIIWLRPLEHEAAGLFALEAQLDRQHRPSTPVHPDDEALVLHTSGTTARPKIVPLTQANLCASARHIRQTLRLTPSDRCLNVMPLFHIHGLMAALLSSLSAGASIVCTPGFYATDFFDWLAAFDPTWYTAVPTMHQAILQRAGHHEDELAPHHLRFIRSSSASLAPNVMQKLEQTFGVPVVEAYGMTEAAHQMASNPLPPKTRKPGFVGPAAGPRLAIMDPEGRLLPNREIGEVVIQGPNVTAGYENNPDANARSFTNGWFRTGDQGYLDEDAYLFITGRIKELINRGGEKIAPREVDEVLLGHPAVRQAVAFAMPDARLGEDVAAAVVLHEAAVVEEQTLRHYAATRLAPFKVPRRILFVETIPKGPTGKLQRSGLAASLGLAETAPSAPIKALVSPRTTTEELVLTLWKDVLKIDTFGVTDLFLEIGGDSMLAMRLVARIRERLDVELSMVELLTASTVAEQAALIEAKVLDEILNA